MPRFLSWICTISLRCRSSSLSKSVGISLERMLLPALPNFYVERYDAVQVPAADNGNVTVDVVLHLDCLLRICGLREAGDVRDRNLLRDLLFDCDLSCRVRRCCRVIWRDLDSAHSEQLLYTISNRGIQRLAQQRIRDGSVQPETAGTA